MKITVVGTGYVGLVTGTCFAEKNHQVVCVDIDAEKVQKLRSGEITIYEPGLEEYFLKNIQEGRLSFTNNLSEGIHHGEIIFLALPTPSDEDGSADLSYVLNCAIEIGKILDNYKVIVNKSTVPVGTADRVKEAILKHSKTAFDVVSNPEFLREGSAVKDFMYPDRVVIGSSSEKASTLMKALYLPFVKDESHILIGDERSSEMTKYAANAYLSARLTFMNEIANLCEKVGANVDMVRQGMGMDDRIGPKFLFPGIGFGGSCFPKDIRALVKTAEDNGYTFKILNSVIAVNESQKVILVDRIKRYIGGSLKGIRLCIWGLAFKPNTDDTRQASAIRMIDSLIPEGADIVVYDPVANKHVEKIFGDKIAFASSAEEAAKNAEILIILWCCL